MPTKLPIDLSAQAGPEPISQATLGRHEILSSVDVLKIINVTGLNLLDDVDEIKFHYWLNNTVEWTLRDQLSERLRRIDIKKLKDSLKKYSSLSQSLKHSELPPIPLPSEWLREAERWLTNATELLDKRKAGGAPANVETTVFVPKALGLFHAGFGVIPDNVVSWNVTHERGAAFRFIYETSRLVKERVEERGFCKSIPKELVSRARFLPVTDDAVGKRINAALALLGESEQWTNQAQFYPKSVELVPITTRTNGPAWELHAAEFRGFLLEP